MRKRSSYRPKGANPTAHLMAMMGVQVLPKDDALLRAERLRFAVDDACQGKCDTKGWRLIFDCVNLAEQLCKMRAVHGIEVIDAMQDTISIIFDRQQQQGTRALYPAEIAALRDFAADYAGILSGVTMSEYMNAQRGVEDRIRRILSGERIPASVRVLEAT